MADGTNPEGSAGPMSLLDGVSALMASEAPEEGKQTAAEGKAAEAQEAEAQATEEGAETPETAAEEDDAEGGEEEAQEEQTFTVKVDGKEESLTLEQLIERAQMGSDYTRKTQEVAEQRKTLEAETAAVRTERQATIQQLTELQRLLSQPEPEPNWVELAQQYDPNDVLRMRFAHEARQKERAEAARALDADKQRLVAQSAAEIPKLIPEWKDRKVYEAEMPKIMTVAQSLGYTPAEIQGATDPRAFAALRDAMLWREHVKTQAAQKTLAEKKVVAAPKLIKGNPPQSKTDLASKQASVAYARFAKAPSIDAAVALLTRG